MIFKNNKLDFDGDRNDTTVKERTKFLFLLAVGMSRLNVHSLGNQYFVIGGCLTTISLKGNTFGIK